MGTNKQAIIRYRTLDLCFRNTGRRYFIEDLIEACNQALYEQSGIQDGVKRRQIFDDISFMESEKGWSIDLRRNKEGKRVWYRYADPGYSIGKEELNEIEKAQIQEVLTSLSRFKGMPQFSWIEDISARLKSITMLKTQQQIIEFDQNPYLKGLEFFTDLYNAILNKCPLKINYRPFHDETARELMIHPYYLKQYNLRWFLFGLNEEKGHIMNLALDRILSVGEVKMPYIENTIIQFSEYFEDVVGVTVLHGVEIETVILEVAKERWPYLETKPLHGSQKVVSRSENSIFIQVEIKPNYEFTSLILSLGDGVKIISPESLKINVLERAKAIVKQYE